MHPLSLILTVAGTLLIVRAAVRVYREGWSDPTVRVSFCSALWLAGLMLFFRTVFVGGELYEDAYRYEYPPIAVRSLGAGGD